MDQPQSFESVLEADLHKLASEVQKTRENPELQNAGEREIVKQAIRAFPVLNQQAPNQAAPVPQSSASASPIPDYAQNASPEVKLEIEYLLETAFKEGIGKALSESQKSSFFVQDAFHDALAGKLYPELEKRGML